MFSWWRISKRKKLQNQPAPAAWFAIMERNARFVTSLSSEQRKQLVARMQVFVAEKYWEGCRGFEITEEVRVTIAAHACRLTLSLGPYGFDNLLTVLVYPDTYVAQGRTALPGGVIVEGDEPRLGEAWQSGPVILAWDRVLQDVRHPGHSNVIVHEFAHLIDMIDGQADGNPVSPWCADYEDWDRRLHREYETLSATYESGRQILLDPYALANRAEFFAVATETFFERPGVMRARMPPLYRLLADFYGYEPHPTLPGDHAAGTDERSN